MVIKYVNGIPFIRVYVEDVRTQLPMNGSWQLTADTTLSLLGSGTTLDEIAEKLFRGTSSSNVTFKRVYDLAAGTTEGAVSITANGLPVGKLTIGETLNTYITGMQTTTPLPTLRDANNNLICTFGMDGPTGIFYPNESNMAPAQYLKVGIVDNHGKVSFAIMYGCYRHASYYPRLQADPMNTFAQGYDEDDLDSIFDNVTWSDDPTPPGPGPSPEPKGGFSLDNRFSPSMESGTHGLYPILSSGVRNFIKDLWDQDLITTLGQNLGILTDKDQMLKGLKWYYGMNQDVATDSNICYVRLGNQSLDGPTNHHGPYPISTNPLTKEFATHDCGTATITPYFNNYLDYESEYKLFIPFYGFIDLNASEVVGGTVGLKYNVKMDTGDAIAFVTVNNANSQNNIVSQVQCNVSVDISTDRQSLLSVAERITMATAKAAVITAGGAIGGPIGAMIGNELTGAMSPQTKTASTPVGSGLGYVGGLDPYILVSRPVKATPANMHDVIGYQDCQVAKLSTLSGYVKVDAIKPESIDYTCKYAQDILNIVQNGIYL